MNVSDFTVTGEHGGMIDVERNAVARRYNLICGAYFHPMGIRFTPTIEYAPYGNTNNLSNTPVTLTRPTKEIIIDPFTCAKSLNVDFDKWTRKNTIRWTQLRGAKRLGREMHGDTPLPHGRQVVRHPL